MSGGNGKRRRKPQRHENFGSKIAPAMVQAALNLMVFVLERWATGGHWP